MAMGCHIRKRLGELRRVQSQRLRHVKRSFMRLEPVAVNSLACLSSVFYLLPMSTAETLADVWHPALPEHQDRGVTIPLPQR